jgi:hypothetical protein
MWKRVLLIILAIPIALYLGDAAMVRLRHDATSSMTVHVYYAVGLKGGSTEFDRAEDETQTCSNSAFPQMGHRPCWWLVKHTTQWVELGGGQGPDQ